MPGIVATFIVVAIAAASTSPIWVCFVFASRGEMGEVKCCLLALWIETNTTPTMVGVDLTPKSTRCINISQYPTYDKINVCSGV